MATIKHYFGAAVSCSWELKSYDSNSMLW